MDGEPLLSRNSTHSPRRYFIIIGLSILALFAYDFARTMLFYGPTKPIVQVTSIIDTNAPNSVELAFNINAWSPFYHPLSADSLMCNGKSLRYAAPVPRQNINGFHGTILLAAMGLPVHCIFKDANGTYLLDIPMPRLFTYFRTTLAPRSKLSIHVPFTVPFQMSGAVALPYFEAWDAHNHLSLPLSSSGNATSGTTRFPALNGFVTGSGEIFLANQTFQAFNAPGWYGDGGTIITQIGRTLPVTWVA